MPNVKVEVELKNGNTYSFLYKEDSIDEAHKRARGIISSYENTLKGFNGSLSLQNRIVDSNTFEVTVEYVAFSQHTLHDSVITATVVGS